MPSATDQLISWSKVSVLVGWTGSINLAWAEA